MITFFLGPDIFCRPVKILNLGGSKLLNPTREVNKIINYLVHVQLKFTTVCCACTILCFRKFSPNVIPNYRI